MSVELDGYLAAAPEAPSEAPPDATADWQGANQRRLLAALAVVRAALERHAGTPEGAGVPPVAEPASPAGDGTAALDRLVALFGLSPFERDLLVLCAGVELDAAFAPLCAAAQGDPARPYPTFSLALAALDGAHWSALTPDAPLRRWRLIEVAPGAGPVPLTLSPLRIDERVLHYLAGVQHLDERLAGLVEPLRDGATGAGGLVPSHRALADRIVAAWSASSAYAALPVIQLCGAEGAGKRTIAAAACAALGLHVCAIAADVVPTAPAELEALLRLWEREAALSASALYLDCDRADAADAARAGAVSRLIERAGGALIVASREPWPMPLRMGAAPVLTYDVRKPSHDEQRTLWHGALGATGEALNGRVAVLVSQFNLSAPAIGSAGAVALGRAALARDGDGLAELVWDACRVQARPRLDDLAQRIESAAGWDDLVLPEGQARTLREIAAQVRHRARVYEEWGFAAGGERGLGVSALFAGASGTGKTLAAEVLANELRLDLYRIDLSQVVSKYIGETEKNLRRVFDAAEEGGAVLLFDEADALFGKRSEVKDSHDRYANIEVSYLLQRMEVYRGLAILTTNLKSALDTAFLRRLRFVVPFPFPDQAQRAAIWRRVFPPATPTEGLDAEELARLNVPGGNIRNIALGAAFLAADAGEPVRMLHLLHAARGEYAKLEKPLTDAETAGWV